MHVYTVALNSYETKFMRPIDVILATTASVALLVFVLWRVAVVKGWF